MMSDKTKKAIRARMAKTGETYSTARDKTLGSTRDTLRALTTYPDGSVVTDKALAEQGGPSKLAHITSLEELAKYMGEPKTKALAGGWDDAAEHPPSGTPLGMSWNGEEHVITCQRCADDMDINHKYDNAEVDLRGELCSRCNTPGEEPIYEKK